MINEEPIIYQCRYCGKNMTAFSCDCASRKEKLCWDKHGRELEQRNKAYKRRKGKKRIKEGKGKNDRNK